MPHHRDSGEERKSSGRSRRRAWHGRYGLLSPDVPGRNRVVRAGPANGGPAFRREGGRGGGGGGRWRGRCGLLAPAVLGRNGVVGGGRAKGGPAFRREGRRVGVTDGWRVER